MALQTVWLLGLSSKIPAENYWSSFVYVWLLQSRMAILLWHLIFFVQTLWVLTNLRIHESPLIDTDVQVDESIQALEQSWMNSAQIITLLILQVVSIKKAFCCYWDWGSPKTSIVCPLLTLECWKVFVFLLAPELWRVFMSPLILIHRQLLLWFYWNQHLCSLTIINCISHTFPRTCTLCHISSISI